MALRPPKARQRARKLVHQDRFRGPKWGGIKKSLGYDPRVFRGRPGHKTATLKWQKPGNRPNTRGGGGAGAGTPGATGPAAVPPKKYVPYTQPPLAQQGVNVPLTAGGQNDLTNLGQARDDTIDSLQAQSKSLYDQYFGPQNQFSEQAMLALKERQLRGGLNTRLAASGQQFSGTALNQQNVLTRDLTQAEAEMREGYQESSNDITDQIREAQEGYREGVSEVYADHADYVAGNEDLTPTPLDPANKWFTATAGPRKGQQFYRENREGDMVNIYADGTEIGAGVGKGSQAYKDRMAKRAANAKKAADAKKNGNKPQYGNKEKVKGGAKKRATKHAKKLGMKNVAKHGITGREARIIAKKWQAKKKKAGRN